MNTAAALLTLDLYAADGSLVHSVTDSNAFEISAPDILARYPDANYMVIHYGDHAAATVYLYTAPDDADERRRDRERSTPRAARRARLARSGGAR